MVAFHCCSPRQSIGLLTGGVGGAHGGEFVSSVNAYGAGHHGAGTGAAIAAYGVAAGAAESAPSTGTAKTLTRVVSILLLPTTDEYLSSILHFAI